MKTRNLDYVEYDSMLEAMQEESVFTIEKNEEAGTFYVNEGGDGWYYAELTKAQLLQLAEEIKELANK